MAEQVDKEAIESVLQQDLKDSRNQIGMCEKTINTYCLSPRNYSKILMGI